MKIEAYQRKISGLDLRLPHSTYRLQMRREFPFPAACAQVDYLKKLGIGAAYFSPIFFAAPGSGHGYDVCDPNRINPELGGEKEFNQLSLALSKAGLGCVIDFVPNHMKADPMYNPLWRKVLEKGPSSHASEFFDIDWKEGKVILPVLENQYGIVLEEGKLQVEFHQGRFVLRYGETLFPLRLDTLPLIFPKTTHNSEIAELRDFFAGLRHLTFQEKSNDPRKSLSEKAEERFAALTEESSSGQKFIDAQLKVLNGRKGRPQSFARLHALLERQAYRLADGKAALQKVNYRSFFDVKGLVRTHMERPAVFKATHHLVQKLSREGFLTGIRIDHVDGLRDPGGYLKSLQGLLASSLPKGKMPPIWVEKILTGEESLPADWPIQGTTGYEFLRDLNGLFMAPKGLEKLRQAASSFTGYSLAPSVEEVECKRLVLSALLGSELNMLSNLLSEIAEADLCTRDFARDALEFALEETLARLGVYRTYGSRGFISRQDQRVLKAALEEARRGNPAVEPSVFDFLKRALLSFEFVGSRSGEKKGKAARLSSALTEMQLEFALKVQQTTGSVQAKGMEDTAFYRNAGLLSLNEVGSTPSFAGTSPANFHARMVRRRRRFPLGMSATSTHDTKRGEDVRARLNVLTEFPNAWVRVVQGLFRTGASRKYLKKLSPHDEYVLYQTLLGCWPLGQNGKLLPVDDVFFERIHGCLLKSSREAKLHTNWLNPDPAYEKDLRDALTYLLRGAGYRRLSAILFPFLKTCSARGALNSLSQVACKCAAPGIPDIYQGTERWDLSLVDPDNRRPVDFALRVKSLESMENYLVPGREPEFPASREKWVRGLMNRWSDGEIKQYVLARCLRWRSEHASLFLKGAYVPLQFSRETEGFLAFIRHYHRQSLVVFFPIRTAGLPSSLFLWGASSSRKGVAPGMENTLLLPKAWKGKNLYHIFTGKRFQLGAKKESCGLSLSSLIQEFPVTWLWLES